MLRKIIINGQPKSHFLLQNICTSVLHCMPTGSYHFHLLYRHHNCTDSLVHLAAMPLHTIHYVR